MIVLDYKNNDTIVWAIHESPLRGPGWYYCKKCIADEENRLAARLGITDRFCPNCGTRLNWKDTLVVFTKSPKTRKKIKEYNKRAEKWGGFPASMFFSPEKICVE